jgi:hypothetical protein
VLVVNRFRVEPSPEGPGAATAFRRDLQAVLGVLARQKGYVDGRIGRNVDDPSLWVLTTTWLDVGSYRRALSSYDVKVGAVAVLSRAIDEPTAYETVADGELNEARPRQLD